MPVATLAPDCCTDPSIERCSVHEGSVEEINRFKWIASQQAGHDLGDEAVREWIRKHWNGFLRLCWLEHLQGKRFWQDLNHSDFGLLQRTFQNEELLNPIIEHLKNLQENLNIIDWALAERLPMERVKHILEVIDINSKRMKHAFED